MKFLRRLFRLIVILALIVVGFFMYNFLQKEEVIVLNNTKTIMVRLRAISKLETAEMEFSGTENRKSEGYDLLEGYEFDDKIYDFLFKDEMNFNYEGRVVAGIDLEKITTGDIITNINGSVSIKLPEAEILYVIIDKNDTPDKEVGIGKRILGGYANMETEIRQQAEKKMVEEAIEKGILEAATKNAREALKGLLQQMDIRLSDSMLDTDKNDEDTDENEGNDTNSTGDSYEI